MKKLVYTSGATRVSSKGVIDKSEDGIKSKEIIEATHAAESNQWHNLFASRS